MNAKTATNIFQWRRRGSPGDGQITHTPPIEEIRRGLWIPFREPQSHCSITLDEPENAVYFMGEQPNAETVHWYDRAALINAMRYDARDPDTRTMLGRVVSPTQFRPVYDEGTYSPKLHYLHPLESINGSTVLTVGDNAYWFQYSDACIGLYQRLSRLNLTPNETSLTQFIDEAQFRVKTVEAIIRSHERPTLGEECVLMNMPRGSLRDPQNFAVIVVYTFLRFALPEPIRFKPTRESSLKSRIDAYNGEDQLICTWHLQLPASAGGAVWILRTI
jgi:hypothetical protein